MRGLLELPDDVKLKILEVSDPQGLRTCQQVCRALYNLTVSSPQIQYILTLDTLGYTIPSAPRLDLSLHQKIEFLERHRRNWSCPDTCQPTEYQTNKAGMWCQFNGGVYAYAIIRDEDILPWHQSIIGLHFYQFPSPNLGLEFREWRIPDLGLSARGFAIDTAQDLLILVELADPSRSWSEGCLIHLRMMGENSQHPKAAVPVLLAEFAQSEGDLGSSSGPPIIFQIEVVGNLLAVLFRSRTRHMAAWVIVWDWNRGVEVTRISTGTWSLLGSFTLLSENSLLLPRCSKSYYAQEDVPEDTFGSLDIYVFNPHGTISVPPRMITSFELPKLETRSCQSELQIANDQGSKIPPAGADTRPKVYELAVQDRLISVNVWLRSFPRSQEYSFKAGILHVPTSLLLHPRTYAQSLEGLRPITVGNDEVTNVPWHTWAHLASWTGYDRSFVGCGQRIAVVPSWGRDDEAHEGDRAGVTHGLYLLDLDRRRVKWAKSGKEDETREPYIMSGEVMSGERELSDSLKDKFWGARAEYVQRTMRTRRGPVPPIYERIMISDEHVIVETLELAQESAGVADIPSLQVYTF